MCKTKWVTTRATKERTGIKLDLKNQTNERASEREICLLKGRGRVSPLTRRVPDE